MKERKKSKPKGYLTANGEKLRAEVREGSLSPEDRRRLVESKNALLQLLTLKPGTWEFQILPGEIEDRGKTGETACEQRIGADERFAWVKTPEGAAKIALFLADGVVGVVLRRDIDKPKGTRPVTLFKSSDVGPYIEEDFIPDDPIGGSAKCQEAGAQSQDVEKNLFDAASLSSDEREVNG